MPRFFGSVGYGISVENPIASGVWVDHIVEASYFGDVVRNSRKLDAGEGVNSDIQILNTISIVADKMAIDNFMNIKYVFWAQHYWCVSSVEVKPPRLLLNLGKVYNGPTA